VPARILDGKALSLKVRAEVSAEVAQLKARSGVTPGLTVILVGEVAASQVYVRNKQTACKSAGMNGSVLRFEADVSQTALIQSIDLLNADPLVHGILVQLPLPKHVDERTVLERIDPRKDVDGFHPENAGRLAIGDPRFVPCTPLGVRALLMSAGVETKGARAVVLGRSQIVGKPMALLLLQKGLGGDATVTICHTATRDVASLCREADILVAAVGRPEYVRGEWIKPGAVVIDVGIHKRVDGSLCGDVHSAEAAEVASLITPVPGGVGPMTVAMLLRNTLLAARLSLA
jgi:methylenetetrahydrofolate dehydrogenase (NADP+) / methenyltetrahydrofolate cyclohydrolase